MRIAMVSSGFKKIPGTTNTIYAPGQLIFWITEELVKRGHDVTLFAADGSTTSAKLESFGVSATNDTYTTENVSALDVKTEMKWATDLYIASRVIEEHKKNPFDVIHCHDYRRMLHFSKQIDIPVLYTYHGNPIDDTQHDIDKLRLKHFYKENLFVGISDKQVELGRDYFNFIGKVSHGIDTNDFSFSESSTDNLIWIGRMMQGKNPDVAIKAAQQSGHNIVVAGTGSGPYFDQEVAPLLKLPGVDYKGFTPYSEVPNLLKNAKAIIVPITWHEPFGMIIIEAMACGTPVIGYNCGSVPELVKDGQTGFVVNQEDNATKGSYITSQFGQDGLVEAINRLYALSEEEYKKMRQNCRENVEKNHSIKTMVDGYEAIYAKI